MLIEKVAPQEKIRTKKKAIARIVEMMEANADNGLDYDGKCYIAHSDCPEDAEYMKNMIEEKFKNLKGKVIVNSIGTVIGSHTGPGTMVPVFFGKERTE